MKQGLGLLLLVAALVLSGSLFTVNEREYAVKFRLGEIVKTDYTPGLHLKVPLINNIRKFDRRILTLDARPERFLTSEKKYVDVDSYVKWRIQDVEAFYSATRGDEFIARERMSQIIKDGLRAEFAKRSLKDVISTEREAIMDALKASTNEKVRDFGIEIVDVRIKRIDLPESVSGTVYNRMRSERKRVANEWRSQGREEAEKIRADADRQVAVLLATARSDAEQIRGAGDAEATRIYAESFGQDPEFYNFYKSLETYRNSFRKQGDVLVLDTNEPFLRYLRQASPGQE